MGRTYAEWEGQQDKALVAKVRAGDESSAELLDWVTSGQIEAMRK